MVANSILLKKYEAIKIVFIRIDSLTRKTFSLEIVLWRSLTKPRNLSFYSVSCSQEVHYRC